MMTLDSATPFVVFGDDWGRYPSTIQHVFRHVATRYPVIWVNSIGDRVPGLNLTDVKRIWEKVSRLRRIRVPPPRGSLGGGVPRAIIEPRIIPWHHVRPVQALNTWSLTRSIRARLGELGLTRPPVLVVGSPTPVGVLGHLGELASVYYVLDDYLNYPSYTAGMLAPLEHRLLERVDVVVATAAILTQLKCPRSGRAFHLPQGVNFDHFAEDRPEPPDLAEIPRPRIGFSGGLNTQCDLQLLVRIADTFPNAQLVFVGPIYLAPAALEPLRRPNVHLMGLRSYDELPAYVEHFDVGIIPYVLSDWTVAVDPLKLLEYLAAGLPVVATAIPEAAKYADIVAVASDSDQFVAALASAMKDGTDADRARRRAFAQQHTWQQRAESFIKIVESIVADAPHNRGGP